MLGAIIEDKKFNTWSQLYFNKNDGNVTLSGFTIRDGILLKFDKSTLSILKKFILGPNRKNIGQIDGFDAVLDESTGLYHFFKGGKEDFSKLFFYNGTPAIEPDERPVSKKNKPSNPRGFRKFILDHYKTILLTYSTFLLLLTGAMFIPPFIDVVVIPKIDVYYEDEVISAEKNTIFDTITFTYEDVERKIEGPITSSDIKDLIYASPNLCTTEKDFLWNQELIDLVVPYYNKYDRAKILSLVRHTGIDIESFKKSDHPGFTGYYNFDHIIHVCNYDVDKIVDQGEQAGVVGHEYSHLLQFGKLSFLKETCATLFSNEFYLNSGDPLYVSYFESCKLTRVLMEIIGPEPVLEGTLTSSSEALLESISPYLNEEECEELLEILTLSPFYDKEELQNGIHDRLYELLSIMYSHKFGSSIEGDGLIRAIMNGKGYSRVYFRESLRNTNPDYYTAIKPGATVHSLKNAWQNGLVVFREKIPVTLEEYVACLPYKMSTISINIIEKVIKNDNEIVDNNIFKSPIFTLTLEDGSFKDITLEEAVSLGYVEVECALYNDISYEEYMNPKDNAENIVYPCSGYEYDSKTNCVYATEDTVEVRIESLQSKLAKQTKLS